MNKSAFDLKHVGRTTAVALIHNGKPVGTLVANWSDNPAGRVCTTTIQMWGDCPMNPTGKFLTGTGKAGGYGYDKLSQAVYFALEEMGITPTIVQPANGQTRQEFEQHGIVYFEVC